MRDGGLIIITDLWNLSRYIPNNLGKMGAKFRALFSLLSIPVNKEPVLIKPQHTQVGGKACYT